MKTTPYGDVVIYYVEENINLEVRVADDTVWLSQAQMALLFGTQRQAITKHLKHIYEVHELEKLATSSILELHQKEGTRQVKRFVEFYNLDVIISVGFRVNTQKGIEFRQWANRLLKNYFVYGFPIEERFEKIEQRVYKAEQQIKQIVQTTLPPKAGLFFNGETFDAYVFVANLIRSAQEDIKLVDNFIDDSVLLLLSKRQTEVTATIYTEHISLQLQADIRKYNTQYPPVTIKEVEKVHDRFLILDHHRLYHYGASFKDLGKRLFVVSEIEEPAVTDALMKVFT
ncbi:MAG: virulence RhuM family protein [Bacteroidales bacterium]|nr:virulence RhuM family protein [Bacteroidales bacterium]